MKISMIQKCMILGILMFSTYLSAYNNPLFPDIVIEESFSSTIQTPMNLYQISFNPAIYKNSYQEDIVYYSANSFDKINFFRRVYDPKRQKDYKLYFHSHKALDKKSTLAAAVRYNRADQYDVYRSLEKSFYDNYFSYIDTTKGNVKYDGPQLWFLYNYSLTNNLLLGFEVDYGIERGLKDVYTKCETVIRNLDLKFGVGFVSDNGNFVAGASARYFSYEGQYNAVKELQDAFVRTYFGYHVFRDENPRSLNRKNDHKEGYEFSAQLARKNILVDGLGIQLSGSYGTNYTKITVGSTALPGDRGYLVRDGFRIFGNAFYQPVTSNLMFQMFYEYKDFSDWARSGEYNVVTIENDELMHRFGSVLYLPLMNKVGVSTGFEMENIQSDYHEYIVKFDYNKDHHNWNGFVDLKLAINQITNAHIKGTVGTVEPWFYWNTDKFDIIALQFGFDRLFVFGTLGIDFNYEIWKPDGATNSVNRIGIALNYWK
ncbi:MAG: hypothetical protein ISS29_01470 [Candidatus Marinimicrobia bacterium]|nr:hypothetical protein [Candidatus Neomarinimicrobiota bacterium]